MTVMVVAALAMPATAQTTDAWLAGSGPNDGPGGLVAWDRGAAGTRYAQWDQFYDATVGGENVVSELTSPGSLASFATSVGTIIGVNSPGTGTGASDLSVLSADAIVTPSSANLYGDATTALQLELTLAGFVIPSASAGQKLVLTAQTFGNAAVPGSMVRTTDAGGVTFAAESYSVVAAGSEFITTPGGSFPAPVIDQQWVFDISGLSNSDLVFRFSAADANTSLRQLAADTAAVPAPSALAGGAVLLVAAAARRRRRSAR